MVVHSSESIPEAQERLDLWVRHFSALLGLRVESCLWVTGNPTRSRLIRNLMGCVHYFEIPQAIDRYERTWKPNALNSPWGLKSGPNFQFFPILLRMSELHPEEWVLQLESDVVPLRQVSQDDLGIDFTDLWVVGALTHEAALGNLERTLWGHLNGVAFYHVGSSDFLRFLKAIWQTSLLYFLHQRPDYAYDCLSSPDLWEALPSTLRHHWQSEQRRFATLPGMVNMSSLPPNKITQLISEFPPESIPWLLHGRMAGNPSD